MTRGQSETAPTTRIPTQADYRYHLTLRTELRRFFQWSQQQAEAEGITASQHQLMLAVRGHDDPSGPTIRDLAGHLLLRHNSVVGLVDRAEAAGLVRRTRDTDDLRVVRVLLTPSGEKLLERLTALHLDELDRIRGSLKAAREALERYNALHPGSDQADR